MPTYTRTGDTGFTNLFGGKRVLKCEELVGAYGTMDELNGWVGLISTESKVESLKDLIPCIQSDLFSIGGSLAGWGKDLAMLETRVTQMEVEIDVMEKDLPELKHFILPGGTREASHMHIARSITRRVERQVVALSQRQKIDLRIMKYLNRLSDLFFVLARFINKNANVADVTWSGIQRQEKKK